MRKTLFVLFLVLVAGGFARAATTGQSMNPDDPYYCPPGAKYCPVPGRDNVHFIDTHFGVDAATGQLTRYQGNIHPEEVANNLTTKEEVILTMPTISVENRYNPNPSRPLPAVSPQPVYGQPHYAQTAYSVQPAAVPVQYEVSPPAPAQTPVARPQGVSPARIRTSEVADQRVRREDEAKPAPEAREKQAWWKRFTAEDQSVPWWKGGLWRNRRSQGDDDDRSSRSSRNNTDRDPDAAPPISPDDMWGDEDEFSGYNPDGSVASGPMMGGPYQQQGNPYQDPSQNPYQSQQPYYQQDQSQNPYQSQQPYYPQDQGNPAQGTGFVGDAYTLPGSPPPTSPYNSGYMYPGTTYSQESMNQMGGSPYGQPQPVPTTMTPTYSDPYASPAPWEQPAQPAPWEQPASPQPPAMVPPPSAAGASSRGSAQFENAVNMVKNSRFAEAKSLLQSEAASSPGNPAVWRWLGDAQYNLLELQDAIGSYSSALRLDPNDYYALRGQGFAYLHRGHELWRKMMEELGSGQRDQAAATFAQAHENYRQSLAKLGDCLRRAPNDGEAVYGEAMAAEGASRKLYSNAISYIKLGPENRERAELFAENCIQVINKGVERAGERARQNPGESGPRALLGGLYLRKAMLYQQLGKNELALMELRNAHNVQKSILDEIDKNNQTAQKGVADCENYWRQWGGEGQL